MNIKKCLGLGRERYGVNYLFHISHSENTCFLNNKKIRKTKPFDFNVEYLEMA